jgi:MarR family transcriptional regulator, transcriptional regulator for hemolysin
VEESPRIGRRLAIALKRLQTSLDGQLAAVGCSFTTYLVLRFIDQAPGESQRALAERLNIEGPTLTHHLDRLSADGLVERVRSTEDRRVWSAVLTPEGQSLLGAAVAVADNNDRHLRSLFSPQELNTLETCLQRLTDAYGAFPGPLTDPV